jgi:hypothetical protein
MKKFFGVVLGAVFETLLENFYLWFAFWFIYSAFRVLTDNLGAVNSITAVVMLFFWLSDRMKLDRERLRKDLDEEILRNYNRTEDRAIARSYALLAEIRKSRE